MKIIPHPIMLQKKEKELAEKERILCLEEYHYEISNSILRERERIIELKIQTIRLFFGISFIIGFSVAVVFLKLL